MYHANYFIALSLEAYLLVAFRESMQEESRELEEFPSKGTLQEVLDIVFWEQSALRELLHHMS